MSETRSYEIRGTGGHGGQLVMSCDHASNLVPGGLAVGDADRRWLATHWGWDIGAEALGQGLVEALGSVLIASRFSRLVCDPNRAPDEATWIRGEVEGHRLGFNAALDAAERARREARYHEPYHQAVDGVMRARRAQGQPTWLLAVHSFTADYMGQPRAMEVGVMYDERHEAAGEGLARALGGEGLRVALNEPYSGKRDGFYSTRRHGRAHDVVYLQVEVRQDLLSDAGGVGRMVERFARVLRRWRPPGAAW